MLILCISILAFAVASCNNIVGETSKPSSVVSLKTKTYKSLEEEAAALGVPVSELKNIPQDVKVLRAAAIILAEYVVLKDSAYSLNISKEDAGKLGIDADIYDHILSDLDVSNKIIQEANKNGTEIDLRDIQKDALEYKRKLKNDTMSYLNSI